MLASKSESLPLVNLLSPFTHGVPQRINPITLPTADLQLVMTDGSTPPRHPEYILMNTLHGVSTTFK